MSAHSQAAKRKSQGTKGSTKNTPKGPKRTIKKKQGKQKQGKRPQKIQKPKLYSKYDFRNVKTTESMSSVLTMSNSNPLISVESPVQMLSIQGVAAAAVCSALRRGFADSGVDPNYPYFSYCYLTQILINYANNSVPQSVSFPRWLVLIGQSLTQKTVKSYGGKMSYRFQFDGPSDASSLSWKMSLGPQLYSRFLNLGVRSDATVNNNFYIMEQPSGYTVEEGERAWQSLLQFLQTEHKKDPMHEMIPSTAMVTTSTDVSAYAVVVVSPGGGNNVGGWFQNLFSELPPRSPLFSKFVKPPTSSSGLDVRRGNSQIKAFSGDGFTLAGLLIDFLSEKQLHMKAPPIFKAVDFVEILEVYLLWLRTATQTALNSDSSITAAADNLEAIKSKFQIPLTMQEVALLLRATCMNAFKDTQHFVQSSYPQTVNDGTQNVFVPFVAGAGCGARPGTTGLLLPLLLKENLLALTRVSNSQGRGQDANPLMYIPVLGKYYSDELDESDYTFTIPLAENPVTFPLFVSSEDTMFASKRTMVKSNSSNSINKSKPSLNAEIKINLIDGATGSDYVAISFPGSLVPLIDLLNSHIREKLTDFTMPVCGLSSDGGINALRSITMSRHWATTDISLSAKIRDPRFVKSKIMATQSPYERRSVRIVSSHDSVIPTTWESVQEFWVLPTVSLNPTGNDLGRSIYPERIQAISLEQHSITYDNPTSSLSGTTLLQLHLRYADRMVKTQYSQKDDLTSFLKQCEETGRGGLLASLAGNALGALFPKAKGLIDTVAQMVPV